MNAFSVLLYGSIALVMGVLVSSVALLPPVRQWNRLGYGRKVAECIAFALLLSVTSQLWMTYNVALHFEQMGGLPGLTGSLSQDKRRDYENAVVREIWVRLVVPPSLKRSCYAHQQSVCDVADRVVAWTSADRVRNPSFQDDSWLEYLMFPTLTFTGALMGSAIVIFTSTRSGHITSGEAA